MNKKEINQTKKWFKNVCKRNGLKIYIKDIQDFNKYYHHSVLASFVVEWWTYKAVLNDGRVVSFLSNGYNVEDFKIKNKEE